MKISKEDLRITLEEDEEDLPVLEANASDIKKDRDGSSSNILKDTLRDIGISHYLLENDIPAFKKYLSKAAAIRKNLFSRYDNGEPVSPSYVSMISYKSLFDSLASGDFSLANELASCMGGREKVEKEFDHSFDYVLGYTLKYFVLNDDSAMEKMSKEFTMICQKPENENFLGYAQLFEAILEKDESKAEEALSNLIMGQNKESKGNGVFSNTLDSLLYVWGVGMMNLARHKGFDIEVSDSHIPTDLLI